MRKRILDPVLSRMGLEIPKGAHILDFGCGAGRTVYDFMDAGYKNVYGYDVQNYLKLPDPADATHFQIASRLDLRLPYADNTFDLVLSDQVFEHVMDQISVFTELHRVTKPGGIAFHAIPCRYRPIEGHIYVPFASVFKHRWWLKLWASLDIRNKFQHQMTADEVADDNAFYFVKAINYVLT